jgi:formate dehydrogenase subunit delta
MNVDNLINMANRIGEFFAAYPDHVQAEHDVAEHLKKFWEPRMRRALLAHLDATKGAGLDPLVLAALHTHRVLLTPPASPASNVSL